MVGASATASGKNARLAAGSHITGRVTGADGSGLGNVSVQVYVKAAGTDQWQNNVMGTSTNASGDYDLGGLKPGTYRIGFADWFGGHVAEFWNDAATVEGAQTSWWAGMRR